MSTRKSVRSMFLICAIIIAPTITSAAAATSVGTIEVSGVKNIASRNTTPVTTFARPVRAPSPMPAPDSMNTVFDDDELAPPAIAPTPSTISADLIRGKSPFSSARPASFARPVMVPMASKKFEKTRVNTSMSRVTKPTLAKSNEKSTAPTRLRSGTLTGDPVSAGIVRPQPPGWSTAEPRCQMASAMTASTVPTTRPMSMPPLSLSATSTDVRISVMTNSRVGTDATEPPIPSPTGGEFEPVAVTKPELMNPMKAMNRPIPTVIASFSSTGTASKIILRRPVAASSTMITPLMTTRAIASGQVTSWMTLNARNALIPRPAAKPNGSRVMSPNRIVMTPAVSAVTAPTAPKARVFPAMSSLPDRMIGFSTTM